VDTSCDLDFTAKRIAWAKWMNCGQTCIGVDYVLVPESMKDALFKKVIQNLRGFYLSNEPQLAAELINGDDFRGSPNWCRIINTWHSKRIWDYLDDQKANIVYQGGEPDFENRFLPPVVVMNPALDSKIMQEEIFGPILPMLTYKTEEDVMKIITGDFRENPLTVYYFGDQDSKFCQRIKENTNSGSFVTNDLVMQYVTSSLPFGGVGDSGYGRIHGKAGFDWMCNMKSHLIKGKKPKIDDPDVYMEVDCDEDQKLGR
jgi:aldehyde dehydrogenase (NAD+)